MSSADKQPSAPTASKVLSKEQAAAAAPAPLPPPGDARREELRKRFDALAAEAEQIGVELGAIDPGKLAVENEIAQYTQDGPATGRPLDGSEVQNAQPGYRYLWEQADIHNRHGGLWVTQRKMEGWEVVTGNMPEEPRRKFVDGTRRWGDTILLRIREDRAIALQAQDRRRMLARTEGVSLRLLEEADRRGIPVHDVFSDKTPEHIRRFASAQVAAAQAARETMVSTMEQAGRRGARRVLASEMANRKLERAIREGTVPGMRLPA